MLSVPRDTYVEIRGATAATRSIMPMRSAGSRLPWIPWRNSWGLEMNYYARINLQGFEAIVDLLGGVVIDVEPEVPGSNPLCAAGLTV